MKAARLLVTLPALLLAIVPPLVDFNASHVVNPLWSGHARLHTVWLVCTNSAVALIALWLMWGRPREPERSSVLLAAALLGAVLLGFFVAAAAQPLYGGALADVNGVARKIGPLDSNVVAFGLYALMVAASAGAAHRAEPVR